MPTLCVNKNLVNVKFLSDFPYESNGIFVLEVGFFSSDKYRLFNQPFLTEIFLSFQRHCCLEPKIKKIFHLWSFFVKVWGFIDPHFGHFGITNARYISR